MVKQHFNLAQIPTNQAIKCQRYFSIRRVPSSSRTIVSPSFTVTKPSPVSTDSIENPIQKYGANLYLEITNNQIIFATRQ